MLGGRMREEPTVAHNPVGSRSCAAQVALVTGAGCGIGAGIARALAGAGLDLVISDLDAGGLTSTADALRGAGARVVAIPADLASPDGAAELGARAVAALGGVDVLVNVAAVSRPQHCLEITGESWAQQLSVNLQAPLILSQCAARDMIERGVPGRIVSISSVGGSAVHGAHLAYDVSKAALQAMTRNLAWELGRHGITVNCVAPGAVARPNRPLTPDHAAFLGSLSAVGRMGTPRDVAAAVAFLCHPDAGFITGQTLTVDGGFSLPLPDNFPPARRRRLRAALRRVRRASRWAWGR
jgi:NAD(P)-dependent dehydrogenase (short-subunit alcohol dehydrogenase family)